MDRSGDTVFQNQENKIKIWKQNINFCTIQGAGGSMGDQSECSIIETFGTFQWFLEPKCDFGELVLIARTEYNLWDYLVNIDCYLFFFFF